MRPREKVKLCQKKNEEWEETMVAQSVLLLNTPEIVYRVTGYRVKSLIG